MMRRALLGTVVGALAMLVAVSPAHASQEFFLVTGTADGPGACAPYPNFPGGFSCTTLRAAITAANGNPGIDVVVLQNAGTYPVSSMFLLTDDIEVAGQNAQTTFLQGNGDRLFEVAPDVTAILYGVTLENGVAPAGDGGAVINNGTLALDFSRVTQSSSTHSLTPDGNGGAIVNNGDLLLDGALIDHNDSGSGEGGGIYSTGSVTAIESTIFANTNGGGISAQTGSLQLSHVTVAGNHAGSGSGGVRIGSGVSWSSTGSLFVSNIGDVLQNCNAAPSGTGNMEDGSACEVTTHSTAQIGLATTLQDLGGQTDVLAIPHDSLAKSSVSPCSSAADQRQAPRNSQACDAGAFEEGATAPPVTGFAFPVPPPVATVTPVPTPTVTPTPTPTPVAGKTVVAKPVKGTIKIKLPGSNTFVDLDATQGIPVGATVDTRHGTVQLTALQKAGGKTETAIFFDGLFKLTQTKTTTDLTLNEPLAPCPRRGHAASAAKKKPKTRSLWGDGHGSFRTKGQYSAATVRGTKWLVQDSCAGTLTRVARGVVSVRDNVRRKTITLRAGKKYLARPKR